jgi:hypothetical protein
MFIMRPSVVVLASLLFTVSLLVYCSNSKTDAPLVAAKTTYGGYDSQVEWGKHILTISACHDCHSPKKMGPHGMQLDSSRLLSGHAAGSPTPDVNAKEMQAKGLIVTNDLTTWIGPWGTSYTANLTSDATGIGNWTESQFMLAIREGKLKGLPGSRNLLPPMPWEMYRNFSDDELKALFAYLKSTTPIKNVVPEPLPPAAN